VMLRWQDRLLTTGRLGSRKTAYADQHHKTKPGP
jgi:hypothetical protein